MREQAGQQRLVHRSGVVARLRGLAAGVQPDRAADLPQLGDQVLPLAHPQVVQELLPAEPPERAAGEVLLLLAQVEPQVPVGEEVRPVVGEPTVLLVGGLLVLGGPLARVLDGHGGGDDQDVGQAAVRVGGQHHPGQPRVDREPRQLLPQRRQPAHRPGCRGVERAELLQQRHAVLDLPVVRRLDERERCDVAEAEGGHGEDDRGQVGAQDLRLGELGPCLEVLLGVEPQADAVGGAAAATGALVRAGPADPLDRQPLHLEAVAVARHPRGPGVDDVADAGHRERGLRHVGGEHHPAYGVRAEHRVLLGGGQPRVQRQDLHRLAAAGQVRPQAVGGVPDLALAGEEDEHVAVSGAFGEELVDGVQDALHLVALLVVRPVRVDERPVADLHRVGAAGDLHDGRVVEVRGEPRGVDRGRGDDELEVRSPGEQRLEVAEQEVDVQAPLVRLVDDDRCRTGAARGRAGSRRAGCRRSSAGPRSGARPCR